VVDSDIVKGYHMIENLLKNGGFTDIVRNSDGTVDATKGGTRYMRLRLSGHNTGVVHDSTMVSQEVLFEREDEQQC